jgi:L-lactate dehydrogenase complex protein LldG
VRSVAAAHEHLQGVTEYAAASQRCTLVPGIGETTFPLESITDPHDLEDVDFAVMPGALAVAENAAVWVNASSSVPRVLYFLIQHLALVVPAANVVSNLHEAYARLDVAATPFGCWISGPSKTADIEQSLVKGAHGSRTLVVFLVDELPG